MAIRLTRIPGMEGLSGRQLKACLGAGIILLTVCGAAGCALYYIWVTESLVACVLAGAGSGILAALIGFQWARHRCAD